MFIFLQFYCNYINDNKWILITKSKNNFFFFGQILNEEKVKRNLFIIKEKMLEKYNYCDKSNKKKFKLFDFEYYIFLTLKYY